MVGLIFLGPSSSPSNSIYGQQQVYQSNETGMYCAPQDYLCHDRLGKEQYDTQNYTQAEYHYELAAEDAIAYPEIAKHYEQLVSALKYGNYTDTDYHYNQTHNYIEEYVIK